MIVIATGVAMTIVMVVVATITIVMVTGAVTIVLVTHVVVPIVMMTVVVAITFVLTIVVLPVVFTTAQERRHALAGSNQQLTQWSDRPDQTKIAATISGLVGNVISAETVDLCINYLI